MASRRRNIEGKGGTYLEKVNIWPTEEQRWDRKRRKIFEEGKYLVKGGEEEQIRKKGGIYLEKEKVMTDGQTKFPFWTRKI